jgi:hypothetical protein
LGQQILFRNGAEIVLGAGEERRQQVFKVVEQRRITRNGIIREAWKLSSAGDAQGLRVVRVLDRKFSDGVDDRTEAIQMTQLY